MPEISRFFGIIIKMYFRQNEHNPPHFHAIYGDFVGLIDIQTGEMLEGDLSVKTMNLIHDWMETSKSDLLEIWNTQQFRKLPPLA